MDVCEEEEEEEAVVVGGEWWWWWWWWGGTCLLGIGRRFKLHPRRYIDVYQDIFYL